MIVYLESIFLYGAVWMLAHQGAKAIFDSRFLRSSLKRVVFSVASRKNRNNSSYLDNTWVVYNSRFHLYGAHSCSETKILEDAPFNPWNS